MVFPQGLGNKAREAGRMKKAKVAIARKIAVILHCIGSMVRRSTGATRRPDLILQIPGPVGRARRWLAGTVVVVTSVNRLVAGSSARRCKR